MSTSSSNAQFKKVVTIKNEKGISAPAMCAWQRSSGNYLALRFEGIFAIFIYDRQGALFKKIPIPTNCTALEWDSDGDILAIMVDTAGVLILWEAHSNKVQELDTSVTDPGTVICWSTVGKVLALGTLKGNSMFYNHRKLRKIPVIGKHTKKITCAKWSKDIIMAFGSIDDQMSLNSADGELIKYLPLRGKPSDIQFGYIKEDHTAAHSATDNTVSCVVSDKTLYLLKYDDQTVTSPMELGFQTRYGNILSHHWHGDGYIVITFIGGFVILLSSHYKEIGTELVLCELKEELIRHAALNSQRGWLAVCCGQASIQIHEASEPKSILSVTEVQDDDGRVRQVIKCHWTDDGQLLAVTSSSGDVIIYLTSVPMMGGANLNQLASMSSLTDCILYSYASGQILPEFTFTFQIQPDLVVVGPLHLAVVIHSSAWLYNTRSEIAPLSNTTTVKKEFNSNVHEFVINHLYCAARCGDKAYLHRIDGNGTEKFDVKTFPESNNPKGFKITCMAMPKEIFLYGGENGVVKIFHMEQWTDIMTVELPSGAAVKGLYPDVAGGQCVILDKHNSGFYFDVLRPLASDGNPSETFRPLPNFPSRCDGVIFDMEFNCRHIFFAYAFNSPKLYLYSAWRDAAYKGTDVEFVGNYQPFKNSPESRPIGFKRGILFVLTGTGRISKCPSIYQQEGEEKLNILKSLVNLRLFSDAYELCTVYAEKSNWEFLAKAALESGQLEIASKSQTRLGNIGMVISIGRMMQEQEDLNALHGDVAMINGDFDLAEAKYLEAGLREKALSMRRDLQEWDKAMEMAEKFNSPMISEICREYAAVYEYNQNYGTALSLYQRAKKGFVGRPPDKSQLILKSIGNSKGDGDHGISAEVFQNDRDMETLSEINKGIARNMLRNGMHAEAMDIIKVINCKSFSRECAEILDQEKEYTRAASLYMESGEEIKAASCYVRLKEFSKAEEILKTNPAPEIWKQLAKVKEAEGNLQIEAARAYAEGFDFENGIRVYLSLGIPEEAASLAKQSDDPQDAVKVALYFLEKGELDQALQYLIRSECYHEALFNAFKYGKTELYADFIFHHHEGNFPEGFKSGISQVAADFETKKDIFRAGKCYQYLRNYEKSFTLLMKAAQNRVQANEDEVMMALVNTCVYAKDENYTRQIVELLLGENDGSPKDPFYIHYYYVMAEKYVEASKTAVIVSKTYQESGSFLEARNAVVDSMCWLRSMDVKLTKDTIDQFNLCHSYLILRLLLSQPDKNIPARILIRLFDNISRFSKACPELLLVGVRHCQQGNMKYSARQMAFTLIKEYRDGIDEKFRPAIEQLVRKTGKSDCVDQPDNQSPCPYCGSPVDDFSLNCKVCKSFIPMCIVTGSHIVKSDLGACDQGCNFPFRFSEMQRFKTIFKDCPVCGRDWERESMNRINDPRPYLYDNIVVESTAPN